MSSLLFLTPAQLLSVNQSILGTVLHHQGHLPLVASDGFNVWVPKKATQ